MFVEGPEVVDVDGDPLAGYALGPDGLHADEIKDPLVRLVQRVRQGVVLGVAGVDPRVLGAKLTVTVPRSDRLGVLGAECSCGAPLVAEGGAAGARIRVALTAVTSVLEAGRGAAGLVADAVANRSGVAGPVARLIAGVGARHRRAIVPRALDPARTKDVVRLEALLGPNKPKALRLALWRT